MLLQVVRRTAILLASLVVSSVVVFVFLLSAIVGPVAACYQGPQRLAS